MSAASNTPTRPPGRFLKLKQVMAETSLGSSTIYRLMAAGDFPRNHPLFGGRKVWFESEVEDWKAQYLTPAKS